MKHDIMFLCFYVLPHVKKSNGSFYIYKTRHTDRFHKITFTVQRLYDRAELKLFILHVVVWDRSSFVCCLVLGVSTDDLLLLQISSGVVWQSRDLQLSRNTLYLLSPRLCFFILLKLGSSGRASAPGSGSRGFDTRPRNTKGVKMVPVATLLGAQHYKASTGFSSNMVDWQSC